MKLFEDGGAAQAQTLRRIAELANLLGEVRVDLGRIEEKVDQLKSDGDDINKSLHAQEQAIANLRVRDAYIAGAAAVAAFIGGPLIVWLFSQFGGG